MTSKLFVLVENLDHSFFEASVMPGLFALPFGSRQLNRRHIFWTSSLKPVAPIFRHIEPLRLMIKSKRILCIQWIFYNGKI